jgi:hypothetical protein
MLDEDMRRIVMATANLPVSIPRGRGRRVVTLYEALFRQLATGKVYRRAAVMDFMRLAQKAAALSPQPARAAAVPSPVIVRLQEKLDQLRAVAATPGATHHDITEVTYYELLLDLVERKSRR